MCVLVLVNCENICAQNKEYNKSPLVLNKMVVDICMLFISDSLTMHSLSPCSFLCIFFQLQVNSVLEKISSSSQELAHYHSGEGKVHVISYY